MKNKSLLKLYEQPLGLGGVLMVGTEIMYLRILRLINSRLKSSQSIAPKVFKALFKENNTMELYGILAYTNLLKFSD